MLLETLDADPQVRARGRSAVVRDAVVLFLATQHERRIADSYARGYGAHPVTPGEVAVREEELGWPEWLEDTDAAR